MAVLKAGSDATSAVDDRAESPSIFGSLDSLTGTVDGYVSVPFTFFPYTSVVLIAGIWLQPDSAGAVGAAADTQGTWGILS